MSGRQGDVFQEGGVVSSLSLQCGPTYDNRVVIPLTQAAIDLKPETWTKVTCFNLMAQHYIFGYPTPGMNCSDLVPASPLYNGGYLSGVSMAALAQTTAPL